MSTSRSRFIVTVLLLVPLTFVLFSSINSPVSAAPVLTLSKTFALRGSLLTFTGTGYSSATVGCTVKMQDVTGTNQTVTTQTCTKSSGSTTLSGSFVVPFITIKNPYTVIVETASEAGLAAFTITAITMSRTSGPRSTTVSVNGSLGGGDTTCAITGIGTSVVGTSSCVITGGTGGNFTGSFVVANVAPGPYTVRVTGSPSAIFVEATFTVTGPALSLTPSTGVIGTIVQVNGTGYSFADTTCTITSPSLSGVVVTPACSINAGTGIPTGNFTIGNVAPGSYVIRVTANPASDFAEATLLVTSGPSITLNPTQGPSGTIVSMTGTGFLPGDKTCTIAGTVVTIPACSIVQGSGAPTGSFTVANVAPGTYVVTVNGNGGDSASTTFRVTVNGTLTLSPTEGPTGTTVTFRATGFLGTDTGCVVLSAAAGFAPGSNNLLIGSYTCTMSTSVATGTFVVGSFATTNVNWNVTVRGTPGNDIPVGAWALFNVTAQISLTPTQANNGTVIQVTGTGFSSTATGCTLTIGPTSTGFSDILCGVSGSSGHVAASFKVTGAAVGLYVATVTGFGLPGGSAGAVFQVGMPTANITLSPNTLFTGFVGFVGFSGSGFNPSATTCDVTDIPTVFTVESCTISSGFVAGSITVLAAAPPGLYAITVTTNKGDFAFNYLGINAVTTQTSTTTATSVSTTATTTATTTTTTGVSSSFTTTTLQTTGISTWEFVSGTATTIFGQTTTTVLSTSTTSSFVTVSTTVKTTVSTTITHTLGQIIQPSSVMRDGVGDAIGLLALLALVVPIFGRRLLS